ncbi:putative gp47 [Burkholderia thailandensis H0587]|nr:putative gp47 [Burkholderia thailandensis H0587]
MNEESTRKISFGANVDQVHIGDSVSHGTPITNSNVVNVQFGERERLVEYVTTHQKRMIAQLVERIVEATKEEPLEVWRKVLARAGARKAKLILKSAYIDVEEYLVDWLGRATQTPAAAAQPAAAAPSGTPSAARPAAQPAAAPATTPAAAPVATPAETAASAAASPSASPSASFAASSSAPSAPHVAADAPAASGASAAIARPEIVSFVHPAACPHCEANRRAAASARFNMKVAVGVLGVAALVIAFFGYKANDAANALHALRAESAGCMFEGRSYAVGSIIDNPAAPDIECVRMTAGSVPEWQTLKPNRIARR